ncbi:hypothetical protein [Ralstonia pseudosolanacearum]|uniref:hypothetical protein n=1 Tax=Ralstonia pseudosolanacearum TaxID=1310165 RepID=UPI001FF93E2A|nr:hypothetical protein [Ralstonia pseudosolanacearum]
MNRYTQVTINGEDRIAEVQQFGRAIGLDAAAPNRYSTLLLIELYAETMLKQRMNPAKVVHEIRNLEAGTQTVGTKPPTPFRHPPLRGLWHKHYLQDGIRSMAMNLRNALKQYGLPMFEERVREAQEANEERYLAAEDVGAIAHDAVMGNYMRRSEASELTGEWIIYAQHEEKNYYLCLGQHDSGDDVLRKKIDDLCSREFPFLAMLLA